MTRKRRKSTKSNWCNEAKYAAQDIAKSFATLSAAAKYRNFTPTLGLVVSTVNCALIHCQV
jgi:hypothetical protein